MSDALLPLFPILPILAAGISVLVRRPGLDRVLLLLAPLATLVGGAALMLEHRTTPVLVNHVGGFVPGIAIPFVSDMYAAVMLTVTGLATAACTAYLIATGEARYRFVPSLVLMLIGGVNGALLTGDLFNLFVFIEVMLLPSYALLAVTGTWLRLGAGRTFVLVNLLTSTVLLIGVGFVYAVAGTVNLGALVGAAQHDPRLALAVGVVLLALGVKAAVVPVHGWLPAAYPSTSGGIMALFAGVHTKVAIYAIVRILAVVGGGQPPAWSWVLLVIVVATILLGALGTFGCGRIRLALAWQMVSGVGHILVGAVLLTAASIGAGLLYMTHHIITMGGLILLGGAIQQTYGTGRFDRLSGMMRREPALAAAMTLGLFSLVGLPPTSGLWGKVALIGAAFDGTTQGALLGGAVVLASVISLLALQRLWGEVFWGPPMETYNPDSARTGRGRAVTLTDDVRVPTRLLAPGIALIAVSVALFVLAGPLADMTTQAGSSMVDVATYAREVLR